MAWQLTPSDGFNQGRPMMVETRELADKALPLIFKHYPNIRYITVLDMTGEDENWYRQVSRNEYNRR